jgi:hypothetical protein
MPTRLMKEDVSDGRRLGENEALCKKISLNGSK